MHSKSFDAAVIGGGSAGYAAARSLAAGGATTVVIDGAHELGGLCILSGCMPTKALLHASELRHGIEAARVWGIEAGAVRVDPVRLFARKNALIQDFAGYRQRQLSDGRFDLIRHRARFADPHTLVLEDGSRIRAGHIVVATGSHVAQVGVPGLDEAGYLTSDDALDLDAVPDSMIILGGGPVAVEFAQFFARMGSDVALIQRGPHLLRDSDPDVAMELEKALRREGIAVYTGTALRRVERTAGGRAVVFAQDGREHRVEAAEILHALGRRPSIDGLALELAGVSTERGAIRIEPSQRTSVPHIYAAGDCCGPYEIVHLAIQQGEIAAHNILHPDRVRAMDYRLLLSVVFSDPQVAQVGLTETAARLAGRDVLCATYPFNDHGKSMILGCQEGFVKLVADRTSGEILGGACAGPQGGELIHEVMVAMAARMTVGQFAVLPHYHPTLAEIWTYPAEELAGRIPSGAAG